MDVADNKYKIGSQVRIIDDPDYEDNRNTRGYSGTVVRCKREWNRVSHIVTVYVLLDEFKAYNPLVVVKGTPRNLCCCGEALQSIIHD